MKTNQKNRLILSLGVKGLMLYILLLALGSCSSCKKEIDALPPETQTGAKTFGALIDGKAYIPTGTSGWNASEAVGGGTLLLCLQSFTIAVIYGYVQGEEGVALLSMSET